MSTLTPLVYYFNNAVSKLKTTLSIVGLETNITTKIIFALSLISEVVKFQ